MSALNYFGGFPIVQIFLIKLINIWEIFLIIHKIFTTLGRFTVGFGKFQQMKTTLCGYKLLRTQRRQKPRAGLGLLALLRVDSCRLKI